MKILFTKNVARQGVVGEVKEVADGYAQFLITSGNAVKATSDVVKANENKIKLAIMPKYNIRSTRQQSVKSASPEQSHQWEIPRLLKFQQ